MSNGLMEKQAIAWMTAHFRLIGDVEPNSSEIHLEHQSQKDIWKEYCGDMEVKGARISLSTFCKLWATSFPHVKIRKYKAVSGKCAICAVLSDLNQCCTAPKMRAEIQDLRTLHRITYMNERKAYYERTLLADRYPSKYMSIILDGMAQTHTQLPWLSNQKEMGGYCFDQHIQGVLEHSQKFNIYRTFNNVINDSNLAIHCLLLQLENRIQRDGKLPDVVFIQIDGGPENANQYVLAVCEMLVARGVCQTIQLSRLPVGHTHEDIDGKFGQLWKQVRRKSLYTPQEYAEFTKKVFSTNKQLPFELIDINVVPDYQDVFKGCIDVALEGYTKEKLTQLAFKFERVPRTKEFPLGVKTLYRAYCSDTVYELIPCKASETALTGWVGSKVSCWWGPTANKAYNTDIEGLYVLKRLPSSQPVVPTTFVANYTFGISKTVEKLEKLLPLYNPKRSKVLNDWTEFSKVYPNVECSKAYVRSNPNAMKFPLKRELFGYLNNHLPRYEPTNYTETSVDEHLRTAELNPNIVNQVAPHSVRWSNRGNALPAIATRLDVIGIQQNPANIDLEMLQINKVANENTDIATLNSKTVKELKVLCLFYGVKATGDKQDIIARLHQATTTTTTTTTTTANGAAQPATTNTTKSINEKFYAMSRKQLEEVCDKYGLLKGNKSSMLERLNAKFSV